LGSEVPLNDDLVAKRTKIGWVVYGGAIEQVPGIATVNVVQTTPALQELFRQLDGVDEPPPEAQFNETCKRHFITHTGERYQVKLPWLEQVTLRDNFAAARARLNGVLNRLLRNGRFDEYRATFFDMVFKGVAILVRRHQLFGRIYFMPHH